MLKAKIFAEGEEEPQVGTQRLLGWERWLEPVPGATQRAGVLPWDAESLWQHGGMREVGSRPGRPRRPLSSGWQPCTPQEFSSTGLELHPQADSTAPLEGSAAHPALQPELFFL